MAEVPKIVTERLKVGLAVPHPDANVLAAFAEQALSAQERETVLAHLAACADCRETIALALPAQEAVPEQQRESILVPAARPKQPGRNWFSWPNLGWAGLAAGVVFAVALISIRHSSVHETAMVVPKAEPTAIQSNAPVPANQPAAPVAQDKANEEARSITLDSGAVTTKLSERQKAAAPSSLQQDLASRKLDSNEFRYSFAKRDDATPAKKELGKSRSEAGNVVGGSALLSLPPGAMAAGAASKGTPAASAPATPARAQTETVEVTSAVGNLAAPAPAAPIAPGERVAVDHAVAIVADESKDKNVDALAENKQPAEVVSKAKEPSQLALQSTESQLSGAAPAQNRKMELAKTASALKASPSPAQWSVVVGALLRSMDAGKTWQTSLRSDPALMCFAVNGAQVWAAGKAGTVYLSQDAGSSWTQLHPTSAGAALTADVTNIELSGLSVILSAGKETWSSIDSGKTWTKK
ncbi:MAG TPA: zf-HC2 domain-containing protein [Terriglobales bacterium]|jgi:hypothetical protein